MGNTLWSAQNPEHVQRFVAHVLAPLIAATRPTDMRSAEVVVDAARAWILCLKDVPADVLTEGVERLLGAGPTWMPRPGDLRVACAGVIAERLAALAPRAAEIRAACEDCHGSGWREVNGGVARCGCHARVLALYDGQPKPLALPPADEHGDAA